MTLILVSTEVSTWTTRERDEEDRWDNGDSAGQVDNVWASIEADQTGATMSMGDSLIVDLDANEGDTIYAVVADYESGSTFGRGGGYASVVDAFTDPELAIDCCTAARTATSSGFEFNGKSYRTSWCGYFESLNSLDVWEIKVRPSPQSFLTPNHLKDFGFRRGL